MQLDVHPTGALSVVRVTTRYQIWWNPPHAFGFTFNDTRAAQRLQTPDVGVNDLVGIGAGIALLPKVRAMLLGQIHAVLAQSRNIAIRGPQRRGSRFDDAADRKLAQIRLPKWHVVSPSVDPVDDDIGPLLELVQVSGSQDAAHDRSRSGMRVKQRQFALLTAQRPVHGPDDVAARAKLPERCLGVGR